MRILVIEDQPEILQNIADYLELQGYLVDCAYDGLGGLHLAITQPFDLIILDLMLPVVDGLSLCRQIRSDARTKHIRILMLTAKGEEVDEIVGFSMGADDYVTKPFVPETVCDAVSQALACKPWTMERWCYDGCFQQTCAGRG